MTAVDGRSCVVLVMVQSPSHAEDAPEHISSVSQARLAVRDALQKTGSEETVAIDQLDLRG